MRRILMVLLITVLILMVVIFLIAQGGIAAAVMQRGPGVISLILSLLQLVGIALGFALVVFVLVKYAQYVRSRRFFFEGFSNASKLVGAEKMPIDLGMLAREELVYQFKAIFNELEGYSDKGSQGFKALVADELYIEENPSGNDTGKYESADQIKKGGMIEDLKEIFRVLSPEDLNLTNLAGEIASKVTNVMGPAEEIAPKEVAPILKFIEAVVPPHIIRATGHLQQWRSDIPDRAGITLELVDLGSQRNLMLRTIWWQSPEKKAAVSGMRLSLGLNMADEDSSNEVQANQKEIALPGDDEISLATSHYLDLLRPAMYWLAMMFWEQKLISHVHLLNRILKVREKRRQARILYLLGALYYAHADQFQAYNSFFCQLAVEHFRQASVKDSNWHLPYLYLANLYSFKAQEKAGELQTLLANSERDRKGPRSTPLLSRPYKDAERLRQQYQLHEKLLNEAFTLYNKAFELAKRKEQEFAQARIILAKSLAALTSGVKTKDEGLINTAIQGVEGLKKLKDPADFDPARADCAGYLYNLALWYEIAYDNYVSIPGVQTRDEARRYLAYSLARSQSLRGTVVNDENFKSMHEEGDLDILKKELAEKPELRELTGEKFKIEIDKILKMVDQELKRPIR